MVSSNTISLIYHDVISSYEHQKSGFPWPDAAIYKLDPAQFVEHLRAISLVLRTKPSNVLRWNLAAQSPTLFLTFDDGGVSAYSLVADELDRLGWVGHFFITTDYIGQPSFLCKEHIRDLVARGHVVGSHSHTHPLRMANCSPAELQYEWQTSIEILSDIIGTRVKVASVPGGGYSRAVAESAWQAGIKTLFTSEPTARMHRVGGCLVLGRYSIQSWTMPRVAAALAVGRVLPRMRQRILWGVKKCLKFVGGRHYLAVRRAMIGTKNATVPSRAIEHDGSVL